MAGCRNCFREPGCETPSHTLRTRIETRAKRVYSDRSNGRQRQIFRSGGDRADAMKTSFMRANQPATRTIDRTPRAFRHADDIDHRGLARSAQRH